MNDSNNKEAKVSIDPSKLLGSQWLETSSDTSDDATNGVKVGTVKTKNLKVRGGKIGGAKPGIDKFTA
ncbi:hypothetical protein BOW53_03685 [Solemya pervernicosa gill symbiont]|uniref:Uncharacterized protein n=2 Tax=Gammaproteobacteria incertae sedis TaxID=118884 RepID=A0A1T2L8Q7_9GAMM|nr:hypothetical protein [Candidatus Reidiella endopervernicosa]OOZ41485.1 hypothetical protein BOW53_03685 [Solemya pervernicosa gill symbiont]QKQ27316.1 hypothetical protein HUE57_14250 [Candidatus Reidiella endopervernicosa]